jgi:hypothetical protein
MLAHMYQTTRGYIPKYPNSKVQEENNVSGLKRYQVDVMKFMVLIQNNVTWKTEGTAVAT